MMDERDDELDAALSGLFRTARAPEPSAAFAAKTMKAVRRAALPAGRQPLRSRWLVSLGWAAVLAVAAGAVTAIFTRPVIAAALSNVAALGLHAWTWLLGSLRMSLSFLDFCTTIGGAIGRALVTPQAAGGLVMLIALAAVSLAMLNRLLTQEESSIW